MLNFIDYSGMLHLISLSWFLTLFTSVIPYNTSVYGKPTSRVVSNVEILIVGVL
jgi:hypothetical protein